MSGSNYMGIPREKIPWYPTIDEDLCSNCGNCLDFCSNGVFEQGDLSAKVSAPFNCVVGCSACANDCPTEAIRFPDKNDLMNNLRKLRQQCSEQHN